MENSNRNRSYWKDNLFVVSLLLAIWFAIAFGGGVFGIEWLNQFRIGQVGLGFWIAQQGAIVAFVLIVLVYAVWMDRLDRRHGMGDDQ